MDEPIAYLNGQYVPISKAVLSVFDLGVVAGASATEMVRTFRHEPFQLREHLTRLEHSLDVLKINPGLSATELDAICRHVICENVKRIPADHDLGMVVFVTAGQNLTYLGYTGLAQAKTPSVCVHTFPLPFELWADKYDTGLHLVTTTVGSVPDNVIDASVKHRNRLHWHLAEIEAKRIDPSSMAVLTDEEGFLTETGTGNLCVVEGTTILTPELHVLHGVSRDFVASLTTSLGLTLGYTRITPEDLSRSNEAFITSTPHCLLPVTKFNHQLIGNGKPGPVFLRLLSAWSENVGLNIAAQMKDGAKSRSGMP